MTWRDVTGQIRGLWVPACTDLWLSLVHLYSKFGVYTRTPWTSSFTMSCILVTRVWSSKRKPGRLRDIITPTNFASTSGRGQEGNHIPDDGKDIRRGEDEHVWEGQRGSPEVTDNIVTTEKRPVAEPTLDRGPHATGFMVELRDPHLELDASFQIVRIRADGAIDTGSRRSASFAYQRRSRGGGVSLIKGETG